MAEHQDDAWIKRDMNIPHLIDMAYSGITSPFSISCLELAWLGFDQIDKTLTRRHVGMDLET